MLSTRMGFWKIAHGQSSHLRRRYETDADRLLTDPAVKDMIAGKRTNTKNKHDNILLKNALHSVKAGQVTGALSHCNGLFSAGLPARACRLCMPSAICQRCMLDLGIGAINALTVLLALILLSSAVSWTLSTMLFVTTSACLLATYPIITVVTCPCSHGQFPLC